MPATVLNDYYKCSCGRLLFKGVLLEGQIEIKCKRCGTLKSLNGLDQAFQEQSDYIFLIDRDANIFRASNSAGEILGYTPEELVTMRIYDISLLLRPGSSEKFWKLIESRGRSLTVEALHQKKDGTILPVWSKIWHIDLNGKSYIIVFVTIQRTARSISEEGGGTSDLSLIDTNAEFVAGVDFNGMCIFVSQKTLDDLNICETEVLGKSLTYFFSDEKNKDMEKVTKMMVHLPEQSFRLSGVYVLERGGVSIPVHLYFSPDRTSQGKCVGYSVVGWRAPEIVPSQKVMPA